MTQACTKCKEIKNLDDFYVVTNKGKKVRRRECKKCLAVRVKKWQKENIVRHRKLKLASYHRRSKEINAANRKRYAEDAEYRKKLAQRSYVYRHTPEALKVQRRRKKAIKDAAFSAYGGYKCKGCGITDPELLNIDHEGGRKKHNHVPHMRGDWLYSWLKSHNYPPGFRVLCFNCNVKAYHNGRSKKYG